MFQETLTQPPTTSTPLESGGGVIQYASEEQRIDLFEVATLVLREKKTIIKFILVPCLLTLVVVYGVMKPMYTARAVFLPPQTAPGSAMTQLASQLGSLGTLGGLGGLKSSSDVYIGILQSRTIADELIKRFDLQKVYKTKKVSDTEKELKARSSFVTSKDTLVTINVEDHDANRAAALANGYLDALHEQNGRLALSESSQRRLFFEEQLEREKNALADAEVELKKTEEQTGLIAPSGQAQMEMQLRAQITSLQIELASLKQGATEENPEVIRLQTQIAGLQQQLQRFQSGPVHQPGKVQLSTTKVPEIALEYVRKQREVKYHETLFELLARQYEAARLDESREAPVLQVVDHALVPDAKSGPPRLLLLIASCLLGALAGLGWVVLKAAAAKLRTEPEGAAKLEALRQAASLGN